MKIIKVMPKWMEKLLFNFKAITIMPFGIFIKSEHFNEEETVAHEMVHWQQEFECATLGFVISIVLCVTGIIFHRHWTYFLIPGLLPFLFFYILYIFEWLVKLPFYGFKAYNNISFERDAVLHTCYYEAYKRKPFHWIKHIFYAKKDNLN